MTSGVLAQTPFSQLCTSPLAGMAAPILAGLAWGPDPRLGGCHEVQSSTPLSLSHTQVSNQFFPKYSLLYIMPWQ